MHCYLHGVNMSVQTRFAPLNGRKGSLKTANVTWTIGFAVLQGCMRVRKNCILKVRGAIAKVQRETRTCTEVLQR
jgi:hypothetical protein